MAQRRPPKAQTPDTEPALRVPTAQIDDEISERLALGQEMHDRFNQPVRDINQVHELDNEFRTWDEYNEEQSLRARRLASARPNASEDPYSSNL